MKIAFAGKGGTGKTTLAAWTADYLARQGHDVWLIDADTAMSLGRASGLAEDAVPAPLTAQKALIEERIGAGLINLNPEVGDIPETLAVDVPVAGPVQEGITPGRKRLLVMGTIATAGSGCACGANALLKAVLAHLMYDPDSRVIIDLEAGVEHLGRGTVEQADVLVVVTEPSLRSLETAEKVSALANELGITKQVLVINRDEQQGTSCDQVPEAMRRKLPDACLSVPLLPGLQAQMLSSASVMNLPEQDTIDGFVETLLKVLEEA